MARGIYLVGFSGSGKSTIAKLLAEKIGCDACDLDDLIVARSGRSIAEIFQQEGETGFRRRESEALLAASATTPFLIATGGGTIVLPENRAVMASRGWIICLEAKPETLLSRIQHQRSIDDPKAARPLLDSEDPLLRIQSLKEKRQSFYALADWSVQTDDLTAEEVAAEVLRAVESLERSHPRR